MRRYLIDQILLLMVGIGMMIAAPFVMGPISTFVAEVSCVFGLGVLCRPVLLLPLDFLHGRVTEIVYFAAQSSTEDLEFHKGMICPRWKFTSGANRKVILSVPDAITYKGEVYPERPKNNEKLKITYFRYSKILLSYESVL